MTRVVSDPGEVGQPMSFAVISDCNRYRYRLGRMWGRAIDPTVLFVMLNPSTADGVTDDNTIRRCIGFAKSWGFGALLVGNKYAIRSTDPSILRTMSNSDAIGPENHSHLAHMATICSTIVCAWGNPGGRMLPTALMPHAGKIHHLGLTMSGAPKHPLYLPADLKPTAWAQ